VARAIQLDVDERRLRELAARLDTLEDRMLTRHSETMRAILTAMSIVAGGAVLAVSILGYFSKSEVTEEVRDMRQAVNYETQRSELRFDKMRADFQQQFTAFAGDALKKPKIEIDVSNSLLNGQVLHIIKNKPQWQRFYLLPLSITNVGQKMTGPISVYLYSSVDFMNSYLGKWALDQNNDTGFRFKYRFQADKLSPVTLDPGEPWGLDDFDFDPFFSWQEPTNMAWCKLQVFYGGELPTEARFQLTNGP